MRRFLAVLMLFILAVGCGSVQAEPKPSAQDLRGWVGKYPTEEMNGTSFWNHPAFAPIAKKMLEARYKIFVNDIAQGVVSPILQDGDLLYTHSCRPHDCTGLYVKIFVDLKKNTVHMCWSDLTEKEDFWISSDRGVKGMGQASCLLSEGRELFSANVKE